MQRGYFYFSLRTFVGPSTFGETALTKMRRSLMAAKLSVVVLNVAAPVKLHLTIFLKFLIVANYLHA
jgi:hypothetical protein